MLFVCIFQVTIPEDNESGGLGDGVYGEGGDREPRGHGPHATDAQESAHQRKRTGWSRTHSIIDSVRKVMFGFMIVYAVSVIYFLVTLCKPGVLKIHSPEHIFCPGTQVPV